MTSRACSAGPPAKSSHRKTTAMHTMRFGVATVDITPPLGVMLWGYNPREATWVEHPLRAEALACEAHNSGWILISADIGGFSLPLTEVLRVDIALRTGLAPEAIMLTATHTHSGPHVTDALWCERSPLESAYFQDLRSKLTQVAETAWQARRPGELVHARTTAPDLASNRRIRKDDGTWTNEWNDPEGRHTGYYDPTVELLGVRRDDGHLDALLVNFGCHPVCYNLQNQGISGDYVSYLKDALETQGCATTVLFTVSGHANIDPRECVQNDAGMTRRVGETLAGIVRTALPGLSPVSGDAATAAHTPWTFTTTWNLDGRMSIYFPYHKRGKTVHTAISAIAAGDCALLGMPGEAVSEYRGIFSQQSPFGITLLLSLANDFIGYLPTDEILVQGAYEADICPLRPMEDELTRRAGRILTTLHDRIASAS